MDLVKLVAELREYHAQIEEAIVSLELLARRRHPGARWAKASPETVEVASPDKKIQSIASKRTLSKKKASKKKSR
jgi:hypothetical protein